MTGWGAAGRVLILGGTGEARELAAALVARGVPVISSLAGRVSSPRLPVGEVRVGGFGGAEGLAEYLTTERISAVVDATHPFAARITANAVIATRATSPALPPASPSLGEVLHDHGTWGADGDSRHGEGLHDHGGVGEDAAAFAGEGLHDHGGVGEDAAAFAGERLHDHGRWGAHGDSRHGEGLHDHGGVGEDAAGEVLHDHGGVLFLVLRRPGWQWQAGDRWVSVSDIPSVGAHLAQYPSDARVLLTTGRQETAAFAALPQRFWLRAVEAPDGPLPERCDVILDRGPFTLDAERELLRHMDVLVTKNSGGPMTAAKLTAARELGIEVVMVERPPLPDGVPVVRQVPEAVDWLGRHLLA